MARARNSFFIKPSLGFFCTLMLFFAGCHVKEKKSPSPSQYGFEKQDAAWLNKLFKDIFLGESAIFTLWGTKPVTSFSIVHHTDKMLEEAQKYYDSLSEEEKKWL